MKIVVDVNIILSALIRDSITSKIILKSKLNLYFPKPSLDKIKKYEKHILKKSGLNEASYTCILTDLFKYVQLLSADEIKQNWDEAKRVMEHIDEEDVVFIAAALSLKDAIIWLDDSDFEKQNKIKIVKTRDMINLLFSKSSL